MKFSLKAIIARAPAAQKEELTLLVERREKVVNQIIELKTNYTERRKVLDGSLHSLEARILNMISSLSNATIEEFREGATNEQRPS